MFRSSPYGWTSQYLLGFFFNYGVYLPFWALWLAHLEVSASNIGLLLGLGFGVRCLANLVITPTHPQSRAPDPGLARVWSGGACQLYRLYLLWW